MLTIPGLRVRLPLLLLGAVLINACGGVSFNMPGPEVSGPEGETTGQPIARGRTAPASLSRKHKESRIGTDEAMIATALKKVKTDKRSYHISPADLLEISVFRESDLKRKVRVTPSGSITLPLIGLVQVGGLDVASAETLVGDKFKKYLVNPQVSVFISEYGNKFIYILGEVKSPGSYPLPTEAPLSVLEALTLAGGFTPYAAVDRTRVIRKSGGISQSFQIEITAITQKGDKSKDIVLEPNDVIFVPESFF